MVAPHCEIAGDLSTDGHITKPFYSSCDANVRTLQVEMACECAPTARDRADERGLALSAALTCLGSRGGCDLLPLNLRPWVHCGVRRSWQALRDDRWATRRAGVWRGPDGRAHARLSLVVHASRAPSSQSCWPDGRWDANVEGIL